VLLVEHHMAMVMGISSLRRLIVSPELVDLGVGQARRRLVE